MKKALLIVLAAMLLPSSQGCGRSKLSRQELERNLLFAEIIKREDRRDLGDDDFFERHLLHSTYPQVRQWCAVALGRIGDPRALPWLHRAFTSEYAAVRAAAAFAAGEIEDRDILRQEARPPDPATPPGLARLMNDPSPAVRMRAVEALGKCGSATEAAAVAQHVAGLAPDGPPDHHAYLSLAITALMRLRDPAGLAPIRSLALSPAPGIQWRAANALFRLRDRASSEIFLRLLRSPDPDVRAHAARGLGICEEPALADALHPLLDPFQSDSGRVQPLPVRVHALQALGSLKNPASVSAISAVLEQTGTAGSDNLNFAVQAAVALGNIGLPGAAGPLAALLEREGPVANAAVIALAKVLRANPERFFSLASETRFADVPGRRAWVQALGELGGETAIARLEILRHSVLGGNEAARVQPFLPSILQALSRTGRPGLSLILESHLLSPDPVVVRAAVAAYSPAPGAREPWKPLLDSYAFHAAGPELQTKVELIRKLEPWAGQPVVQETLRSALKDRLRNVRAAALAVLRRSGAPDLPDNPGPSETATTDIAYGLTASSRQDRTVAILETGRGNIEMELFREDAPLTVANFVALARQGYFNGLSFMRVVPYFVIQGGDPRNDQEGGPEHSIRCEINLRPFERGSVGMALAGKDTGGSQFFIALSAQPHLDGGYTCFGRVVSGMPVAESMVAGDRITGVRIREEVAMLDYRRF